MRLTSIRNAFANIQPFVQQLAAVFVRDILDAHHEMTAAHVPDQWKVAQPVETLFEIRTHFSYVTANIAFLHDFDILEAGGARDRMTGIGKPVGEPGVRIGSGNDFVDSVAEESGS